MGYTFRDIDKALMAYIEGQNFTVLQDNTEVRVRTFVSSPDEMIAQKRFPAISVEPGWIIDVDPDWQKNDSEESVIDGNNVIITRTALIDLFYHYKIGFYVNYRGHCKYLEGAFLFTFPRKFTIDVTDTEGNIWTVPFMSDSMINMDEVDGDLRLYRRDLVVKAHLAIEKDTLTEAIRPFAGMRLDLTRTDGSTSESSTATV